MPWCGTGSSDVRPRCPTQRPGFAVHVAYVRPPGAADRLAEWAPRIVGDVAAIDAWWRSQDPTRAPRFDLFPFACASPFGQLDISNVTLPAGGRADRHARSRRSASCSPSTGSSSPRRPTSSTTTARWSSSEPDFEVCGVGDTPCRRAAGHRDRLPRARARRRRARFARSSRCTSSRTPSAPSPARAPHHCSEGHVCDVANDLLNASLSGDELETHVLDGGRDDYYGHQRKRGPTSRTRCSSSGSTRRTAALPRSPTGPHGDRRRRAGHRSPLVASLDRRRRADRLSRLPGRSFHLLDDVDLGHARHRRERHEHVRGPRRPTPSGT